MDIFSQDNYKDSIKFKLKEAQPKRPGLTMKKLASLIPIQYTYLSKALNDSATHLNEDHIYCLGQLLEFSPSEVDFLLLQRSAETSQNAERREFLKGRIETIIKEKKLEAQRQDAKTAISDEMKYLLDPYTIIVHLSLDLEAYRNNPKLLCGKLNICQNRLKKILTTLDQTGIIDLDPYDNLRIKKHYEKHIHFGKENPLVRVNQSLLRTLISSHLNRTEEQDKVSMQATFSASERDFEEIKTEFQEFLRRVEKIARRSNRQGIYQLSFDLFRWL